jgi:hypothetical protein
MREFTCSREGCKNVVPVVHLDQQRFAQVVYDAEGNPSGFACLDPSIIYCLEHSLQLLVFKMTP